MGTVWRVAEAKIDLTYDGPALVNGTMPVAELAPALLALGQVYSLAGSILEPHRPQLVLEIKGTRQGSFIIDLILDAGGLWDSFRDLVTSEDAQALEWLITMVGGFLTITKRLHGRWVTKEDPAEDGNIRLHLDDGTIAVVSVQSLELYRNIEIRRQAKVVVQPLRSDGIDELVIRGAGATVRITEEDVAAFELPPQSEDVLLDNVSERVLSIAAPVFVDGNKWRLTDGEAKFSAIMEDQSFLGRVDAGEKFAKGDMLRCRLRTIQTKSETGLKAEYRVEKVLEHILRAIQLPLPEHPPEE